MRALTRAMSAESFMFEASSMSVSYDSVYIDRTHSSDYHLNPHRFQSQSKENHSNCLNQDTVVITDVSVEYRYKLKRDTILRTQFIEHHDSIPYEVIVTQTKEVRAPPTWYDKLAYAIAIAVLIFLLFRIRSPIFSFIRKFF